ncbi:MULTISPECIES: hypothetical protein [unclassified Streptomyces]|uniref:hypothetical protein n=1 Tax=unclassified Streptomyces TaxID=2593676 RepID=UPI00070D508B|nr:MULTISPECIES: hypothetical protein [unclassified Streptomyces]KRD20039.1 hypothetical protein ASE41_16980 [Streptomyces sp. Root264]
MNEKLATDAAADARHVRYGSLPERIRFEDMTEGVATAPEGRNDPYDPDGSWKFFSCLALDLGL